MNRPWCLILFLLFSGCQTEYLRFDNDVPGKEPKVFAKALIAPNDEYVGYCAFSPDGKELYYAITNQAWDSSKIIRINSDNLDKRDTLYLRDRRYEGEPFLTRDGDTMYFMAVLAPEEGEIWQSDLYRTQRTGTGWGVPEKLDTIINSKASEWHMSVTNDDVMYFTSERLEGTSALHGDIYRVEIGGKKFVNLSLLDSAINTKYNDSDPLVAPDESFLIFHSDRPGGFGEHDLYVSFLKDGKWTPAKNMGSRINTPGWEMAPALTPDGKYLLYTYRKAMVTPEPARILWVSTDILDDYR